MKKRTLKPREVMIKRELIITHHLGTPITISYLPRIRFPYHITTSSTIMRLIWWAVKSKTKIR